MPRSALPLAWRRLRGWLVGIITGLLALAVPAQTCSVPGQAGANTAITAQPNTFMPGTANAAAGATSITVGAGTGVNRAIQPGDLLLIIQMQGADFDATNTNAYGDGTTHAGVTNTVAYGSVTGYAGGNTGTNFYAGTYEWAVAANTVAYAGTGKTLQLMSPLVNSYYVQAGGSGATAFKRAFQVVRVPQYSRATISSAVTVQGWNGSTGGILAIDVAGDLSINANIEGSGRGFRGGGSVNGVPFNTTCTSSWNPPPAACQHYRQLISLPGATTNTGYWGGSKGEGIAGTPGRTYRAYDNTHVAGGVGTDGYPNGDMGRGAPGNAGGGGNAHNAGGGGGGNGGAGGNGGNSWNSSVSGNVGHRIGGFGGAPSHAALGGATVNRLFLGGGGGAGDLGGNGNAVPSGSGGAGGALVILHASRIVTSLSGAVINVNGEAGRNAASGETDGAGGGGAGGTVVIKANVLSGSLTVNANGGAGGNYLTSGPEQDGAGGGGGGGLLFTNLAGITFNAAGGAAGTSASNNCPPAAPSADCGQRAGSATAGASGYAVFAPGVRTGYECLPQLQVTKSTTTPTITAATGATAQYVINIRNQGGGARFVDVLDWALPPGWTRAATAPAYASATTGNLGGGAETNALAHTATWAVGATPATVPASGSNSLTWSSFALPPVVGGTASSLTITFVATIPDTASAGTYHNPAGVRFLDPTRPAGGVSKVSPNASNTANRSGTSFGTPTYSQYNGVATTVVAGTNHSGLVGGPASDDVTLLPNLRVLKSTPFGTATTGLTFSYVLAVQNVGRAIGNQVFASTQATDASATAIASNPLRITDTLPAGYTPTAVTASPSVWVCGTATGLVTCTASNPTPASAYPIAVGSVTAPVSVGTVTVTVLPAVDACGSSDTNTVTLVTASIGETTSTDNLASITHPRRCAANIQVSKTNGTTTVVSGSTTSYTITVANLGPANAAGTVITDPAATGLSCTSVSCTAAGGASCPGSPTVSALQSPGLTITPTFPPASTVTLVLTCNVTATGL